MTPAARIGGGDLRRGGRDAVSRRSPLRQAAWLVLAALALGACKRGTPPPEDPETVYALVDDLLDQGDPVTAVELLDRHALATTPRGMLLSAEAAILSGDFEQALQLLTGPIDVTAENVYLLTDACVMGALAAWDEGDVDLARQRMAPCVRHDRIDARATTVRATPEAPSDEQVQGILDAIRAAEPAPEIDVAAEQLELGLVEHADAVAESNDLEAIRLLGHAFAVAHEQEIGARLARAYFDAANARCESDPQTSATLFEHVYLRRVEGLEPAPELVERATDRAQACLLPVFTQSMRSRYDRKFSRDDIAAGRFDAAAGTFDVGALDDPDDYAAFLDWLYRRYERPRPSPTPDILGWAGVCTDRAQPCRFTFDDFARIAYYMREIEEQYLAANPGVTFEWTDFTE